MEHISKILPGVSPGNTPNPKSYKLLKPEDDPNYKEPSAEEKRQNWLLGYGGVTDLRNTFDKMRHPKGFDQTFNAFRSMAKGEASWHMLLVYGGAGNGKCLGKGTKVVKANGELCKVEDVKIGDALMGIDSKPKKILFLHRGYGKLFIIKQARGMDYIVNENHILYLRKAEHTAKDRGELMQSGNFRRPRGRYPDWADGICITVKEYLNQSYSWKQNFYGYRNAVDFPHKTVGIPSYLLGVWLGDGTSNAIDITTGDDVIKKYIFAYASRRRFRVSTRQFNNGNKATGYRLVQGKRKRKSPSLLKEFRKYHLFGNKHIPANYLCNSRGIRLKLLAGFIDADGHRNSNCFDCTIKNKRLAEDIQYLCHSLGLRCSLRPVTKTIRAINFSGEYFRLNISGDTQQIPVKIGRRRIKNFNKNKDTHITSIEVKSIGSGDYYGFEIEGDGLFLLEDFTITHNSHLCEATIIELYDRGIRAKREKWSDIIRFTLKASFGNKQSDKPPYAEQFAKLRGKQYLIIDDVGMGSTGGNWEWGELEDIVDYRLENGLFTIITTNLDLKGIPPRIVSRFRDSRCRLICNEAPDQRPFKG